MKTVLIILVLAQFYIEQTNAQTISKIKKIDVNKLRCLVCQKSLFELEKEVKNIDPTKKVDVGGYRLDTDGNIKLKTVPQSKSEIHLSDIIENVCNKMDDYVRGTWKGTEDLTILKIVGENGGMNSDLSKVDVVQDDDLNKSLKYYCEGIMEEYEEIIIKHIQNDISDIQKQVCQIDTNLCGVQKNKEEL